MANPYGGDNAMHDSKPVPPQIPPSGPQKARP